MYRTYARTAAILGTAALALTGCSTAGADSSGTAEIDIIVPIYSDATQPFWEGLVDDFESEHDDIKVNLQTIAFADLTQEVNTRVSTQQTPDLLVYSDFAALAADDLLLPAEDVLPAELLSDMQPNLVSAGEYDGQKYGIPFLASVRALFYNKALFSAAGLTEPPATWDELIAAGQKLVASGVPGYGLAYGTTELDADLSAYMWNNGGEWKDGDAWTIDAPENVEALSFLSSLVNEYGITQPGGASATRNDVWQLFGQGGVGMVQGANFLPTLLQAAGSTVDIGIAPMPTSGDADPVSLAVEDYMLAFRSTQHPEAVRTFLSFVYADESYSDLMTAEGMLPVTQSAQEIIAERNPAQAPFIDLLQTAKFYPTDDPTWPTIRSEVRTTLGAAIAGTTSAEDELASLQSLAENR